VIPAAFVALPSRSTRAAPVRPGGALAWPVLVACVYACCARLESCGEAWTRWGHAPALWLVALVLGVRLRASPTCRSRCAATGRSPRSRSDPSRRCSARIAARTRGGRVRALPGVHLARGGAPVAAFAALVFLLVNASRSGDAAPLPYLPLLDPADLALALLAIAAVDWWLRSAAQRRRCCRASGARRSRPRSRRSRSCG
jgi:hypothetical protein